jgi:hypothetical protein
MLGLVALSLLAGAGILALWYFYWARAARNRGILVLDWIESALLGQGQVAGVRWQAPSRFQISVRLRSGIFREASLIVQMFPRELPLHWLRTKLQKQQETVTFQANLDLPPSFNLELHNYRLYARTHKSLNPGGPNWRFEQTTPFILTTRPDWQKEITSVIGTLIAGEDRCFVDVVFHRTTPHFTATLPLDSIAPDSPARSQMFESLRELATRASASQV